MRDIEEIYRRSINPINSDNIIKLVDVYSYSDSVKEYEDNIMEYTEKSNKKNLKLKEELYKYLSDNFSLSINEDVDYFINFKDNEDIKDFSLVLNTNYNSTMKLTKVFLKECIKNDLDFDIQFNIFGETDNSFMINCTGDNIYPYLNIINKLREKFPNLFRDINEPGPLFSQIDDVTGICSYNYGLNDFYKNRSKDLFNSIENAYMNYISNNYKELYVRKDKYVPIINLLTYYVTDEVRVELNNSELSDSDYYNNYGFSKNYLDDGENFRSLAYIVKAAIIDRFDKNYEDDLELRYITDKEHYIKIDNDNVKKAFRKAAYDLISDRIDLQDDIIDNIYNTCTVSNIDKDNYAFDNESVLKNNKVKTKKML